MLASVCHELQCLCVGEGLCDVCPRVGAYVFPHALSAGMYDGTCMNIQVSLCVCCV